jgi:hypothetical protein
MPVLISHRGRCGRTSPGTKLRNAPKGRVERTEETDLRQAQVVRAEQDREEAQGDGVVEIIDQAIHATGWFVGGKARPHFIRLCLRSRRRHENT